MKMRRPRTCVTELHLGDQAGFGREEDEQRTQGRASLTWQVGEAATDPNVGGVNEHTIVEVGWDSVHAQSSHQIRGEVATANRCARNQAIDKHRVHHHRGAHHSFPADDLPGGILSGEAMRKQIASEKQEEKSAQLPYQNSA